MGVRLPAVLGVLVSLAGAPAALAQSTASRNWAGYAIHRPGGRFQMVAAEWRQPSAVCRPGHPTYASFWVGLGGYKLGSTALEQIGTELDCTRSGRAKSSGWFELVPRPSVPIPMRIHAGDVIAAAVLVNGHHVSLEMADFTTRHLFVRHRRATAVDVSSAEWIVEAPSACLSTNTCITLPLADFGSTQFSSVTAETVEGHRGGISDPTWSATAIALHPGRAVFHVSSARPTGAAFPGPPLGGGSSFSVTYETGSPTNGPLIRLAREIRSEPRR